METCNIINFHNELKKKAAINEMKLYFADKQVRNNLVVPVYKMQIKLQLSFFKDLLHLEIVYFRRYIDIEVIHLSSYFGL